MHQRIFSDPAPNLLAGFFPTPTIVSGIFSSIISPLSSPILIFELFTNQFAFIRSNFSIFHSSFLLVQ